MARPPGASQAVLVITVPGRTFEPEVTCPVTFKQIGELAQIVCEAGETVPEIA
jgi:hypothetical protein